MYIKLPETPSKFETIIDSKQILCFNERAITFKGGQHLDSCEEWQKVLKNTCNRQNIIFEKFEEIICNRLNKIFEKLEGLL